MEGFIYELDILLNCVLKHQCIDQGAWCGLEIVFYNVLYIVDSLDFSTTTPYNSNDETKF